MKLPLQMISGSVLKRRSLSHLPTGPDGLSNASISNQIAQRRGSNALPAWTSLGECEVSRGRRRSRNSHLFGLLIVW